ncbi:MULTISPECIES: DUF4342 domain-containing protein [Moorena]|uniref:DUF4342 domain-containing protein n=1 Tax=Moorena producens (strain JHB) TaxID=1454205 RepID=A0A1D9G1I4_MOOP1|nr:MULTISPECIES: DUF4342 domain-containing protein [Moorena]NEQ16809.1 DUF4342 domain-containing protein [Moorena sp. SIO3E2]AOY81477.1 DUF4342 domain-containing protein [Moorena producens JHB]NEQ05282.1 DUF4342 domain-containing protein [Moorena sp. SIO4E2]NER86113.1 DUF4342 domain-containing protein [Moorena sp. SIO3A2]NET62889.1 DUF4342 domain-containing protein [Moorena sp. SIO1G6]
MNEPTDQQINNHSNSVETDVQPKVSVEEFSISGNDLIDKVKDLINQGNIRRIMIKNDQDRILLEIPLTFGVLGGFTAIFWAPWLLPLGAIGALAARLKVVVERKE